MTKLTITFEIETDSYGYGSVDAARKLDREIARYLTQAQTIVVFDGFDSLGGKPLTDEIGNVTGYITLQATHVPSAADETRLAWVTGEDIVAVRCADGVERLRVDGRLIEVEHPSQSVITYCHCGKRDRKALRAIWAAKREVIEVARYREALEMLEEPAHSPEYSVE